ncbi:MAG: thioredoxin family protein [Selenomonadales bacterium]|jgi:glutaredoxin|nr:thioredoxin family protein [Selenomonadales bacterium]
MSKTLRFFMLQTCPHCKNAIRWMEELRNENPSYAKIPVVTVNEREQPDVANQFMYDLVPTYYLDKTKLHEGVASKDKIRAVFDAYMAAETKA